MDYDKEDHSPELSHIDKYRFSSTNEWEMRERDETTYILWSEMIFDSFKNLIDEKRNHCGLMILCQTEETTTFFGCEKREMLYMAMSIGHVRCDV